MVHLCIQVFQTSGQLLHSSGCTLKPFYFCLHLYADVICQMFGPRIISVLACFQEFDAEVKASIRHLKVFNVI